MQLRSFPRCRFAASSFGLVLALLSGCSGGGGASGGGSRDGDGAPVKLRVRVDGVEIGSYLHREERGFHPFVFDTAPSTEAHVEFEITSSSPGRDFCFFADSR